MMRLVLLALALVAVPVRAQSPEILVEALKVARAELQRQHVTSEDEVVFDTLVARAPLLGQSAVEAWSAVDFEAVRRSTDMKLSTMKDVRTCTTLRSGEQSCTLRPTRAVVVATRPLIHGNTAMVLVALRFQPREPVSLPGSREPIEVHYLQNIRIELATTSDGWTVIQHTLGPPGMSFDW